MNIFQSFMNSLALSADSIKKNYEISLYVTKMKKMLFALFILLLFSRYSHLSTTSMFGSAQFLNNSFIKI